jgi:type 1 glutamine amidotransferase
LGSAAQGIIVLHHAILAFPEWPLWSTLVGIPDRRFASHMGEPIRVAAANPDHPITRGLGGWDLVDETYVMQEPGADSEILLTTANPKSMRALAWTRRYGDSPVLCLQPGHGRNAYADPNFQTILARGIRWCAGRPPAPTRS